MRTTVFTGLGLAVAGAAAIVLSSWLDLELESAALLGVALGAVMALVSDGSPGVRAGSFLAGVVFAWVGYFARAAVLPDSAGGRAVALVFVVALCVGLVIASVNRVSLWMPLTGSAAMAGVYETAYSAAPSQVVDTSMSAVTTVLLTAAIGFAAALAASPQMTPRTAHRGSPRPERTEDDATKLEALMEETR